MYKLEACYVHLLLLFLQPLSGDPSVIQSRAELSAKLKKAEEYKTKMFEREEVNDEIQGLAAQEMAKIKHMVRRNIFDNQDCICI